jgi:Asp-tRNA(Asn)/Glu-tRNA(Gln) amidotransferase C subunit
VATEGGDPEVVLSNAPKRAGNFFVVPKVLE